MWKERRFDEKACRGRTRESYPLGAYQSIDDFLRETEPSPNTHRSNKMLNVETGKKDKHCFKHIQKTKHYFKHTLKRAF